MTKQTLESWIIFIALSFIWGSSFILMKLGLEGLTAFQVASIRIVSSAIVLLPVAINHFRKIPLDKWLPVCCSGLLGSLLPAYLFCMAEQGIDSALAGTLNSLTPIFVIISGALFFGTKPTRNNILGLILAFTGCMLLFLAKSSNLGQQNLMYIGYILLATLCYGVNVNLVHKYLHGIPSLHIVSLALTLNALPAAIVLMGSGYFAADFTQKSFVLASLYSALLGVVGTAVASVIFYKLIKSAGAVFASMVTYGIPFVASFWGLLSGEEVGWKQVASLSIILLGVYVTNRRS